jgi:hypothetical protein
MSGTALTLLVDGLIGLAVIVGAVVLLAVGKLDATSGIALISTGAAVGIGSGKAALALKVPTSGS